jgi:FtsZ-binding cell division protein ZapB
MLSFWKLLTPVLIGLSVVFISFSSHAGLFDDEEARKAILDLRQKVDANKQASDAAALRLDGATQKADATTQRQADEIKELKEGNTTLRRSLLDLQNQIEAQRAELASLRGQGEQVTRDVAEMSAAKKTWCRVWTSACDALNPSKSTSMAANLTPIRLKSAILMPLLPPSADPISSPPKPLLATFCAAIRKVATTRPPCSGWATRNTLCATTPRPSTTFAA